MCLVIAVMLSIFAFNAFAFGHLLLGSGAIAGALFFVAFMVGNIVAVRKQMNNKNRIG